MECCWVYCPFVAAWGRESAQLLGAPGREGVAHEDTSLPISGAFNPIILLLFNFVNYTRTIHPRTTLELVLSSSFIRWETEARSIFLVLARSSPKALDLKPEI